MKLVSGFSWPKFGSLDPIIHLVYSPLSSEVLFWNIVEFMRHFNSNIISEKCLSTFYTLFYFQIIIEEFQ